MRAIVCDNCQTTIKTDGDYYVVKIAIRDSYKDIKVMELCPECFKDAYKIDLTPRRLTPTDGTLK